MTLGLVFTGIVLFAKDKFIVKEEVDNHNDDTAKDKSAGVLDEVIGKVEMENIRDGFGKVVERSDEAKTLRNEW